MLIDGINLTTTTVGVASGVASLGNDGRLTTDQIPEVARVDTHVVATQAAMLALTAQTGDIAVRTDQSKSYILRGTDPATILDWQELLSPPANVTLGEGQAITVTMASVTGLVTELGTKEAVANKGAANGYAPLNAEGIVPAINLPASSTSTIDGVTGLTAALAGKEATANKGAANGYAPLNAEGVVPAINLPASVATTVEAVAGLSTALAGKEAIASKGVASGYAGLDGAGTIPLSQIPQIPGSKLDAAFAPVATSGLYADLTGKPELAPVATTGNYSDLAGLPDLATAYTLPKATDAVLGGVKAGAGVTIDVDGVLTVPSAANAVTSVNGAVGAVVIDPYVLPAASTTVLGGIKSGYGVSVDNDEALNVNFPVTTVAGKTGSIALDPTDITGLATVAATGNYDDLLGKPSIPTEYTLIAATDTVLGGIKVGSGLEIAGDGTLSNTSQQTVATTTSLGSVKVGTGLAVDNTGMLSVTVTSGVSSVAGRSGAVVLAHTDVSGLSAVANTGSYLDLSDLPESYSLPAASASTLGGVKVGSGLAVDGSGTLSAIPADEIVFPVTQVAGRTGNVVLAVADVSGAQAALGFTPENAANKGVINGYCALDADGKVPYTSIPTSLLGANYQGAWNASTNTPTIVNGVGTAGYYYKVSVAGSTNIDGTTAWDAGDTIIFNGTVWELLNAYTPPVSSVFGRLGDVVLNLSDITTALGFTPADDANVVNSINGLQGEVELTLSMFSSMATMPHDVSWSVVGLPAAGESILRMLSPRPFTVPANFAGSIAKAYVAPTLSAVFTVMKENTQIATITFAPGSNNGVFSTQAEVTFATGDRIAVFAPVTQDATLADVDFAILSTLI